MPKILTGYTSLEEVAEDQRQFYSIEDEKVFYQNDGLITALTSERNQSKEAKAEAERLKAEVERLTNLKPEDKEDTKDEPEDKADNSEFLEMQKSLKLLQDENNRNKEIAENLSIQSIKESQAKEANFNPKYLKLYDDEISKDERGIFIKDTDGTAKVNPLTGQRLSLKEFYESKVKDDPNMRVSSPQGSGFSSGFSGSMNSVQATSTRVKEIKDLYNKACMSGDSKQMSKLLQKAMTEGIKI